MKPIIFLDVDGVLNRLSDPFDHPDFFKFEPVQWVMEGNGWDMVSGFPLRLSLEMGAALLAITDDIRWATSWTSFNDYANPCIGPRVGFPTLAAPMLDYQAANGGGPTTAKRAIVRAELERDGPPVIWIDDDVAWKDAVPDPFGRLLCIRPDPSLGLTKTDLNRIHSFLEERCKSSTKVESRLG